MDLCLIIFLFLYFCVPLPIVSIFGSWFVSSSDLRLFIVVGFSAVVGHIIREVPPDVIFGLYELTLRL